MKKILSIIISVVSINSFAQYSKVVVIKEEKLLHERLKVGDKVPDFIINDILNYEQRSVPISHFRGKLLIIDFWTKFCTSCIAAFPKMEQIQKKFGSKVQVLLVTSDKKEDLKVLFENSPIVKNTHLPMVTGDTIFLKLFPYLSVPYHVWIDEKGIVSQSISGVGTTEENISKFLEGKQLDFPQRYDNVSENIKGISYLDQIYFDNSLYRQEIETYSLITRRSKHQASSMWKFITQDTMGNDLGILRLQNNRIIGLFRFSNGGRLHVKTIVELKLPSNLSKYYPPKDESKLIRWNEENTYCYELKIPQSVLHLPKAERIKEEQRMSKKDLEEYFKISSGLENRIVPCYVLKMVNNNLLQKSIGGQITNEITKDGCLFLKNVNIGAIRGFIADSFGDYNGPYEIPVFNETGYNEKIDANIRITKDIDSFNLELKKLGLQVIKENRNIQCLILREL